MGKYKDNYVMANKKGYKKIKSQLRKWGLKFNELFLNLMLIFTWMINLLILKETGI